MKMGDDKNRRVMKTKWERMGEPSKTRWVRERTDTVSFAHPIIEVTA